MTARTEPNYYITGFANSFRELPITSAMRLQDAIRAISGLSFGSTDCSLPMLDAARRKLDIDAFIIYTDNETWAGAIHPSVALNTYRKQVNHAVKSIVVGMTATQFTIADPRDSHSLDVVGFDTDTPSLIADFISD